MCDFDRSCHALDFESLVESDDFSSSDNGNFQLRGFDPFSIAANKASSDEIIVSIAAMSDRLGLGATVENQAKEIFKKVKRRSRRRKNRNAFIAACIYVSCRLEGDMTRSIKEISSDANGARLSDISREIGVVAKTLQIEKNWLMNLKAVDFIKRFCSALEMDSQGVKAAQEVAQSSQCVDSCRSPVSVAAMVVYVIYRLSDGEKSLKGIAESIRVPKHGIITAYKDLYPHLYKIIPKWFAEAKGLKSST